MNNLFNDDITKSIAATVQNVLEGKPAVKKEAEYDADKDHNMDPTSHVVQKDGKFHVFDVNNKKVATFDTKAEADAYSKKNHDALMKKETYGKKKKHMKEVEEPNVPTKHGNMGSKQGEAEFKKMHKGKKSGETEDGKVVKEYTITVPLNEETIDVDYIGGREASKKYERKFKIKIKDTGSTTADITGSKANLIKFLKSDAYLMDEDEIEELYPELMEGVSNEESEKQAAYKKVFNMALKKFGVSGIGELDAEKKKEFFNFVDKNYEAKAEELDKKGDDDVDEITGKQAKKLPPALVKAIKKKEKEEVKEGKLSVKAFVGSEAGGPSYKKFGLRLKKLGSSQFGGDDVELSGPDNSLLKFAKAALGVGNKAKNVKDAQKEIDDQM
tara:strand:- start:370 stop:1524 length:1155 start_codon:yes stop_codon:yes gene_type:complete